MRPRSRVERMRAEVQRVERAAAQDTWVMGRVLVEGVGEAEVKVPFPLMFGEKPLPILGGGELDTMDSPERFNFPTANAVVSGWDIFDGTYYKGCELAITTTGRADQRLFVTFAFVGLALSSTGVT